MKIFDWMSFAFWIFCTWASIIFVHGYWTWRPYPNNKFEMEQWEERVANGGPSIMFAICLFLLPQILALAVWFKNIMGVMWLDRFAKVARSMDK